MIYNEYEVLRLLDKAISDVQSEINKHKSGIIANGTTAQLECIYKEIKRMKTVLNPEVFSPSYPRIIVDSWDFKSTLGNDLLILFEKYKEL